MSKTIEKVAVIGFPVLTSVLGYLYGLFQPDFSIHSLSPLVYSYGYNSTGNLIGISAFYGSFAGMVVGLVILLLVSMTYNKGDENE